MRNYYFMCMSMTPNLLNGVFGNFSSRPFKSHFNAANIVHFWRILIRVLQAMPNEIYGQQQNDFLSSFFCSSRGTHSDYIKSDKKKNGAMPSFQFRLYFLSFLFFGLRVTVAGHC